jgi:rhomboid protease GluP
MEIKDHFPLPAPPALVSDLVTPSEEPRDILLLSFVDRDQLNVCSLVLSAQDISHSIRFEPHGTMAIYVDSAFRQRATVEITAYLEENRNWPPRPRQSEIQPPIFRAMSMTLSGCLAFIYGLSGEWRPESPWFRAGAGDGAAILDGGEWYRLATALTLHADVVHLLSNCLLGAVVIHYLLGLTGNGIGLMLILFTSVSANAINVWVQGGSHHFVGFSTAVFSTIGLLCTIGYGTKGPASLRHLFMPLMAGLALLALLGAGGERTDLGSHLFGLLCGLVCGVLGRLPGFATARLSLVLQTSLSLGFFLILAVCWLLAFH